MDSFNHSSVSQLLVFYPVAGLAWILKPEDLHAMRWSLSDHVEYHHRYLHLLQSLVVVWRCQRIQVLI